MEIVGIVFTAIVFTCCLCHLGQLGLLIFVGVIIVFATTAA